MEFVFLKELYWIKPEFVSKTGKIQKFVLANSQKDECKLSIVDFDNLKAYIVSEKKVVDLSPCYIVRNKQDIIKSVANCYPGKIAPYTGLRFNVYIRPLSLQNEPYIFHPINRHIDIDGKDNLSDLTLSKEDIFNIEKQQRKYIATKKEYNEFLGKFKDENFNMLETSCGKFTLLKYLYWIKPINTNEVSDSKTFILANPLKEKSKLAVLNFKQLKAYVIGEGKVVDLSSAYKNRTKQDIIKSEANCYPNAITPVSISYKTSAYYSIYPLSLNEQCTAVDLHYRKINKDFSPDKKNVLLTKEDVLKFEDDQMNYLQDNKYFENIRNKSLNLFR